MTIEKQLVSDEDTTLMVQFQKGNKEAFNTLFGKYQQSVINVITRYIGDRAYAEDMAQEVFLKIYRARNKYRPITQFKYYLFTIVHNLCLNEIRDTIRHKTKTMDFSEEGILGHLCARGRAPPLGRGSPSGDASGGDDKFGWSGSSEPIVEHSQNVELALEIKSAIESLPPQQRMAIILDKYEGLSNEETARIMKQSVPAVKSILWRARQNLKERLRKYMPERRA